MAATKNTDTAADEIPRGFNLVAAHLRDITVVLNAIEQQMVERNDLLRGTAEAGESRAPIATIADADVLARLDALEGAMSSIPGKMDDLTALVKSIAAMVHAPAPVAAAPVNGEAKAIANRIIEHTVAQVQAGVEAAPAKRGRGRPPKVENCKHGTIEDLSNGLVRCLRCGATLDLKTEKMAAAEAEAAAKAVEEVKAKLAERIEPSTAAVVKAVIEETKKPAPKESVFKSIDGKMVEVDPETLEPLAKPEVIVTSPEPKVEAQPEPVKATLDDVRAVAIGYAGKHGKEKLGAVLVKYGAGNLSSVPAEKYDALMVELQAS
jgi:hypothetical protein